MSLVIAKLGHLPEPLLAEGRQVHRSGQGHEGLVGTDIAGGPLPPYVLLSGAEGKDVSGAALAVHRLACYPPRHLPHVPHPGGEEPYVGPAEAQGDAQGLALARYDVCAVLPRRLEKAHSYGICGDHQERARLVGHSLQGSQVLQIAKEVWILEDEAG